jgi:Protein of unknown function (DUF3450)
MWRLASNRTHFPSLACWGLGAILLASSALVSADQSAGERYAKILADSDSLAGYNQQLTTQLEAQQAQIALIEKQLVEIDTTAAEVPPLIQKMFESLEKFLASDLPFLDPTQAGPDSRQERIARIRDLMTPTSDADESAAPVAAENAPKEGEDTAAVDTAAVDTTVAAADAEKERALKAEKERALNAERYRRLLEAYQIELDYGRTMVSYKGKLEDGRDADFVRVGRVSLLYRTTDGEEAGYWDAQQKKWVADNDFNKAIENAVLIATKESAPDLVTVPVPAPQEVPL